MSARFFKETEDIYRLRVPFENLYTSVFLLSTQEGPWLVDAATTSDDVDRYIVPALKELGYEPTDLLAIVLTHKHSDHAGGSERIVSLSPDIEVITDIRSLANGLSTYPMPGHTKDSIGVFDERSGTLLSGDGLQGAGVGRFRCSLSDRDAYIKTVNQIKNDIKIQNVLFSHAYEPWNCDSAFGRQNVEACLLDCIKCMERKSKL